MLSSKRAPFQRIWTIMWSIGRRLRWGQLLRPSVSSSNEESREKGVHGKGRGIEGSGRVPRRWPKSCAFRARPFMPILWFAFYYSMIPCSLYWWSLCRYWCLYQCSLYLFFLNDFTSVRTCLCLFMFLSRFVRSHMYTLGWSLMWTSGVFMPSRIPITSSGGKKKSKAD